jgi:4-hydroxybenzoate polyprenyltransferase
VPIEPSPASEPSSLASWPLAPPAPAEPSVWWRLGGVVKTLRPHQWIKNVFVLAPVVFAKEIFDVGMLARAGAAFAVFCLLAGAVYVMNDLADIESDRQHPLKRLRPIASGRVPIGMARGLALGTIATALLGAVFIEVMLHGIAPPPAFGLFLIAAVAYFGNNVLYTYRLKHIAYMDVSSIAAGFVLRVLAGGFATDVSVSRYILICTLLLASFLGFGKRRHELTAARSNAKRQRAALEAYTKVGLDVALWITALATIAVYVAYTLDPRTRSFFKTDWLWPSALFVVLSLWRFMFLVRNRPESESPTQEMLKDGPFVAIVLLWAGLVMWVVYHLRPGA